MVVTQVYVPWFLSHHNKDLEWRTLKPPRRVTALGCWIDHVIALRSRKDHVIALRQISVTALFYLKDSRKIHLRGVRARLSKDAKRRAPQRAGERERELALAPLFICLSLPGPVLCKLGQPGVLFVLLEVPTLVLGPSFVLFSLFLYVCLSLGLSYVNWASQECCLFYLRSSLWSSDLPLFYFHWLFSSLSTSHRHSGLFSLF